jgi:hypothetical protein
MQIFTHQMAKILNTDNFGTIFLKKELIVCTKT